MQRFWVLGMGGIVACGGSGSPDPRYPARAPGCEVRLLEESPRFPTDNIGTVSARCDEVVSKEDCLRQLKDEACRLGADVVWGVPEKAEMKLGKQVWNGRAAHTK